MPRTDDTSNGTLNRGIHTLTHIDRIRLLRPSRGIAIPLTFLAVGYSFLFASARSEEPAFDAIGQQYDQHVRPILKRYCLECHLAEEMEGELDLQKFQSLADVRDDPPAWLKVREMLAAGEMPPKDSPQPSAHERRLLRN